MEVEIPIACLPHEVTFAVCSVSLVGPLAVQIASITSIRLPTDQEIRGGGYWEEGGGVAIAARTKKGEKEKEEKNNQKTAKVRKEKMSLGASLRNAYSTAQAGIEP